MGNEALKGKVKWFDAAKGYGFITPEGGNAKDVFVHYSGIKKEGYRKLDEGEEVQFEIVQSTKGLKAENVVPL